MCVKLLVLTQYYPPETDTLQNRLSDLARRLADRGHQVQVLTALPSYPDHAILPVYQGREITVEHLDSIDVARVGLYVPASKVLSKWMLLPQLCLYCPAARRRASLRIAETGSANKARP